jgi:hypothetical protein
MTRWKRRLQELWKNESGILSSHDYLITVAILVMGTIVGLATLRDSIVQEFGDMSLALENVSQSYSVNITFAGGSTQTYSFTDGAAQTDTAGAAPGGINLSLVPDDE